MRAFFVGLFALAAISAPAAQPSDFKDTVVQVVVAHQQYDAHIPWQKHQPGTHYGYAVAIENGRLLTTETLVRNNILVELRKTETGEKHTAAVDSADYQADCAILRPDDVSFGRSLKTVTLATNVPDGAELEIIQFDETGAIQIGKATILRHQVSKLPQAPFPSLTFTLLADLNVNADGAPVMFGGALAGLIIQYDRGTRTAVMLPYPVLKRYSDEVARSPYRGLASAGFSWASLLDPAKRTYMGVPTGTQGIFVSGVLPGSGAAAVLKAGDVILECDGFAVNNLGFYDDPQFGRLPLPHLIGGRHAPGDTIPLTIVRDQKRQTVNLPLTRRLDADNAIPDNVTGDAAEYVADGGFVIRELTGDYLFAHGPKWQLQANPRLVHLYLTRDEQVTSSSDRVVILSRVLPDPINVGVQHFSDEIVMRLNGQSVTNMGDVFSILTRDGALKRLSLQGFDVDIVVDQEQLPAANERIMRIYDIPKLRYRRTKI